MPENSDVVRNGFGNWIEGALGSARMKFSVDCQGPPVAFKASRPGQNCVYMPYPRRTTVVASPNGRIASPIRGLQLLASFSRRLRTGSPALRRRDDWKGRRDRRHQVIRNGASGSDHASRFESNVNMRSNFSTHGV